MRHIPRLAFVVASAIALSGCLAPMTDDPYPVTDNSPNPAPVRTYRVKCQSEPGPFNFIDDGFVTACQQEFAPARSRIVIRAKG